MRAGKLVKRVAGIFAGVVVFLVLCAVLFAYIYQDKIKNLAVQQVNKYLVAKVIIKGEDISFSFLQHFPLASVDFNNFIIKDPLNNGDLAMAKSLSIQFNPIDIWYGTYQVKKILLKDATLNLRIDKSGKPNYIIWKTDSTSTAKDPISLQLKNISLLRVKVIFDDLQSSLSFENDIHEAFLAGKLYEDKFLLDTKADIYFSRFSMNNIQYIRKQQITLNAELDMDTRLQKYSIKEGKAEINHAEFDVSGFAQNLTNSVKVDYTIKSRQNKIQTLMALMPKNYAESFNDYESEGAVYFTALIKGIISDKQNPAINVNYGITNGRLIDKKNNIALEKINCKGSYSNGAAHNLQSSEAELKDFSCMLKGKKITASMFLRNFSDPYLRVELNGSASLADMKHFLDVPYMEKLEGLVDGNIQFKGKVNDLKTAGGRTKVFISGKMNMKDVAVSSKQYNADYNKMNGSFAFDGNDLQIAYFNGLAKSTDFDVKGEFKNLAAFVLLPDQKLFAQAVFHSRHLSLEDFMTTTANANTTQVSNPQFTFPAFLLAEMDVMIDKLTYRKIILADFNARVNVNEKSLNIKNAEMAAFGGNLNLTGTISTLPKNRLRSEFIGSCKEIEVSQLFYALEDFGQEVVTHKNIKGTLTSKTNFSLDWNPDLTPDLKTAVATSDFFIDNGRLSDLEPMKKLGKFTEVSGLNNLTFSRMSNQIYIHDEKIFIPKMDIKSSAMDMTVAGTHTFDNIMDFHITMNVSQLVFGKNRKTEDEFGAIEVNDRGGVNLFIKMSGPVSDPKISYDGKVARKLLGNSIKEEAKQFNNLLNGENIVGPDGKKRNDLNKVQDDYQINWGDEETTNTQTQNSSDNEENTVNQAQQNRAKAWEKFKGKISTNKK